MSFDLSSAAPPDPFAPARPAERRAYERVIVLDTETTGLHLFDRLVSLAAIRFEGGVRREHLYRVYDPRKDNHPSAAAVHGWDDWTLRFQDLFADDADEWREWLDWGEVLVMHNAAFDTRMIARELRKAGARPLTGPIRCTLEAARRRWAGESARLDDCLARIGLARAGRLHGAYEDALLTAHLYFHLEGGRLVDGLPAGGLAGEWPVPENLRVAPPCPPGQLPRRPAKVARRKAAPTAMRVTV